MTATATDTERDVEVLDLRHLRRLWPFVAPYRAAFGLALLTLAVSFVLELAGPYLVRCAIDGPVAAAVRGEAAADAVLADLWRLSWTYLLVIAAAVGLGYGYAMLTARAAQRVIRDVRTTLFDHLLRVSPRFHDRNPAGRLVTRVTTDVENLNELIATGVLQSLFDLLKIAGFLLVLFWIDGGLALLALLLTPVLVTISLRFRGRVRQAYREVRGALGEQNAFTAELVGGVRVAKAFGSEARLVERYARLNGRTRGAWLQTVREFARFVASVDIAVRTAQVGILLLGSYAMLQQSLTAGAFVQFWLYFNKLAEPIRELGERYNVLQSAFSSSERIFALLDEPVAPRPPAQPRPSPRGPASLRFEDVGFAYRAGEPVLHGVSFALPPGRTTALVGPTGAGKSTILALASRLSDPTEGTITLDGTPLQELDLEQLRRRVAVVPQGVFLFTGSVLDNVRLFDDTMDEARCWAALDAVGARDFVEQLPRGVHSAVQERGATLSAGQRQLLSFARALVADPDLLILDEATASIDSESEALVQRGVKALLRGRTALVVAHRLSTVRDADQILVLQGGRIVERGRHAELAAAGGVYARMLRHG